MIPEQQQILETDIFMEVFILSMADLKCCNTNLITANWGENVSLAQSFEYSQRGSLQDRRDLG